MLLKNNRLKLIDETYFLKLLNFRTINLENNLIESLLKDAFRNLTELFYLKSNQIAALDNNAFIGLNNLNSINLVDQSLIFIQKSSFRGSSLFELH